MQRKLLSLTLALVMCLGLAVPAFAADIAEGVSALQVTMDVTEVEKDYSVYTESCTAGYTAGSKQAVYNSMKPGTPITVSNVAADSDAVVYVYFYRYNYITTPTTVYDMVEDENGEYTDVSYEIQNVYYGNDFNYALTDRNDHAYRTPEDYTASINGFYWLGEDVVDSYTAEHDLKVIHPGESVTFTLPDTGGRDVMYSLYTEIYYPRLDDGEQNCCFYRWYNIKLEDAPAAAEGPAEPPAPSFTDVPADAYYAAPVAWAVKNEITSGTGDNKFSPSQNCTNAQILTFIWRAYGKPEPTIDDPFTNSIPDGYKKAAVWAHEKGMVSGTSFDVDKPCTRAMAMTYLWQAAGSPETEPSGKFTDVAAGAPYAQAVAWAVANGITKGATDTTFAPENICQRGQIAVFLYNALADKA